jgi:hypothetical protein
MQPQASLPACPAFELHLGREGFLIWSGRAPALHRPTFEAVLESLEILRAAEPGDTPAVHVPLPRRSRQSREVLGGSGIAQEALAKLQDPNHPSVRGACCRA